MDGLTYLLYEKGKQESKSKIDDQGEGSDQVRSAAR